MNKSKRSIRIKQKRINWMPLIVILLLLAAIVWIIYQFKGEKRFVVVKLYSKEGAAFNLSKNYNYTQFSGNISKGSVLAEEGDVLGIDNNFLYFNDVKKDLMQVDDSGDSLLFVNGNINSIIISHQTALLSWFRTMKASEISALETIYFCIPIPGIYIPYLKEIARLKPNTALSFEADDSLDVLESYMRQADFFSPRFVSASMKQEQFNLLSRWKTLECLYLNLMDSVITRPLPAMPSLKECIVFGDEIKSIDPSFFSKNVKLEKVSLTAGPEDYAFFQPLRHPTELIINNFENEADLSALKNKFSQLSVLIVSGNFSSIEVLPNFKNLRWLGLPANTSQLQFNTIAAKLRGLQVLELQGSDSITSFAALRQLPDLRALVITDTLTDIVSLYAMKNLRYLSVPGNSRKDSAYVLALEKALPGCIIVPNSGACLGSGWLLLLVPLVLLAGLLTHTVKHKFQKIIPNEIA